MKSVKLPQPVSITLALFVLLTLLMVATRGHHFASLNHLPSASTAIFFIAGMYLRNMKAFWFFYLLTIGLDLASSYSRGYLGDCLTPSYPALVVSYGLMFVGGYWAKPQWRQSSAGLSSIKVAATLFIVGSIAFFISNGSYYAFSGNFASLSWQEYLARVEKYYASAVTKPVFYVVIAVAIDFVGSCLLRQQKVIAKFNAKESAKL
ncbi:hypothetical protein tinsulaeT_31020 [Thalassotalea insulae]|uniref:Uncharacterized protein n=1 Tax=Thalassotalea insulae TaxID=2056778 RepID=A0ABQ6GWM6_9GAMM|nr:hypothetical protein [Thalassotalea insulae]GLX79762.1 hypothetical protein tinsulaeT_31020 [Thalassotalea insulae]